MAKAAWYQTGDAGWETAQKLEEEARLRRDSKAPRRFWLEQKQSAKVTFLDSPKFFCHEHNLKIGKSYFNYFTCRQDLGVCPICESGDHPSYILVGTIINHKPFTTKDGKTISIQKQLIVARGGALERIKNQISKRKDLTLAHYELSRSSLATSPNIGDEFEFLGKVSREKLAKLAPKDADVEEWLAPFDYAEIFYPKEEDELRILVGGKPPVGSRQEEETNGDDDDDDLLGEKNKPEEAEIDTKEKKPSGKKENGKANKKPSIDDLF